MNTNIWAKTILSSYRYLERIAGAIDKMVESSGIHSRDMSGVAFSNNNILSLAEKMIDLSERKVKLINLKVLTENTLEMCGESFANILISKYLDGKRNADISQENNLSLRTYFRRLNDAEERFEQVLARKGFTYEKLDEYLKNEKWIMEVKNRLSLLRGGQELELSQTKLDRLAVS